jgi:hypothetical protein
MIPTRRYRCRYCGAELPAWLPVAKRPDGALLLGHLAQRHPLEIKPYLARIAAGADIAETVVEVFDEAVKEHQGDGHELSIDEQSSERTQRIEGAGRYAKTFYGAEVSFEITCSCGNWSYEGSLAADVQASHMDSLM